MGSKASSTIQRIPRELFIAVDVLQQGLLVRMPAGGPADFTLRKFVATVGVFWCLLTGSNFFRPCLPMITPPWRILSWIALFCLLTVAAEAQAQNDAAAASPAPVSWEQNAISPHPGLVRTRPAEDRAARAGPIQLSAPSSRSSQQRLSALPARVALGVNDHFELNSDIDTYFDHGLRKGSYGDGISALHFGAKYAWLEWLKPTWDNQRRIQLVIPVSRPPIELTDGHDHFVPYIVLRPQAGRRARPFGPFQRARGFHHRIFHSRRFRAKTSRTAIPLSVTPECSNDRDAWHYTPRGRLHHDAFIGAHHDFLTIRPGVVWDLPKSLVFMPASLARDST